MVNGFSLRYFFMLRPIESYASSSLDIYRSLGPCSSYYCIIKFNMSIELIAKELQVVLAAFAVRPKQARDVVLMAQVQQELLSLSKDLSERKEFNQHRLMKCLQELKNIESLPLHLTFTSFLLKLISLNLFNEVEFHQSTIEYLISYQTRATDELIVKGFQCFMPIVRHDSLHFGNVMFVERVLQYVLYNRESKLPYVSQSCIAVHKQLLSCLADDIRGCAEDDIDSKIFLAQSQRKVITNKWLQGLCKFMLDAVSMVNDQRPEWYPERQPIDKELALRILQLCIENMNAEMMKKTEIQNIFKYNLILVFQKALALQDKNQTLVTFKCLQLLLERECSIFIDFVEILRKYIDTPDHTMQKTLSLQVLIVLAEKGVVAAQLQQSPQKQNPFHLLLTSFVEIAQNTEMLEFRQLERHINWGECCESTPALVLRLISVFMERFSQSIPEEIVDFVWKPCHRILKHCVKMDLDQELSNILFDAISNWVQTLRNNKDGIDYFMRLVCSCSSGRMLTPKKEGALKSMLRLINGLGRTLTCEQWTELTKSFVEAQLEACEVNAIFQEFSKLLGQCYEYDPEHLLLVLEGISRYLYNLQEEYLALTDKDGGANGFFQSKVSSAMDKLYIVVHKNLFRLDLMWETLKAYLLDFIDSKSSILMLQAATTMCDIIVVANGFLPSFLVKVQEEDESLSFRSEKWLIAEFQDTLCQPLTAMFGVNSQEVHDVVFRTYQRILQTPFSSAGWQQALLILKMAHKLANSITDVIRLVGQLTGHLGSCDETQIAEYLFIIGQIQKRYRNVSYDEQLCTILHRVHQKDPSNILVLDLLFYFVSIDDSGTRENATRVMVAIIEKSKGDELLDYFYKVQDLVAKKLGEEDATQWENLARDMVIFHDCLLEQRQSESLLPHFLSYIYRVLLLNRRVLVYPYTDHLCSLYDRFPQFFLDSSTFLNVLQYYQSICSKPCQDALLQISYVTNVITMVSDMVQSIIFNTPGEQLMQCTIALLSKMIMIPCNDDLMSKLEAHQITYVDCTQRLIVKFAESGLNDAFYTCWCLVLEVEPYDDRSVHFLMDQLFTLHLSLKKVTNPLPFLRKLSSFVKRLRSDGSYQPHSGKSVWMKAAEVLLDVASLNDETVAILQDTLPSRELLLTSQSNEHTELMKSYLPMIVQYHKANDNPQLFSQFSQSLTNLCDQPVSPTLLPTIEPLVMLGSIEGEKSKTVIPLLMKVAEAIFRDYLAQPFKNSYYLIYLLGRIVQLRVPINSFINGTPLQQTSVGHLCTLLPFIAKCVVTQDDEVRLILSQALMSISEPFFINKTSSD